VAEDRPVRPLAARAKRRWDGEQVLRKWRDDSGGELVILRVAGIYGRGRLPLERLRKGLPLIRESEAPFSNRIHVSDLVQVCMAAMARGRDGEVYNVSDGHPTTMTDYFNRLADAAGLPRSPLISLAEGQRQLSPGMLSYTRESRRLDNRKMLGELGVELKYPTLDRGLPACLE
jgi:nucleoside-diphosphate-sugar epimerase